MQFCARLMLIVTVLFAFLSGDSKGILRIDKIVRLSDQSLLRGSLREASPPAIKRSVLTFLGVPYATPPIGKLRFSAPRPPAPWRGTYNATRLPNACMQANITFFYRAQSKEPFGYGTPMSEDCLYLNIWAPSSPHGQISYDANRTIMVYIHGGSFVMGSITTSLLDGRILASEEDVIVISISYRLNIFGFLYAGNELSPGNMGLLDQLEALRWISRNARHFGGDPDKVVLFGLSAGARSISLHLASEMSRPYFSRAILQSGSSLCPWTYTPKDEMLEKMFNLAHFVNCTTNDEFDRDERIRFIVQCLKEVPATKLIEYETLNKRPAGTTWTATSDGQFLTNDPEILMRQGQFQRKDVLFGFVKDEGMVFLTKFLTKNFREIYDRTDFISSSESLTEIFHAIMSRMLPTVNYTRNTREQIFEFYFGDDKSRMSLDRIQTLNLLMSDYLYICCIKRLADHFRSSLPSSNTFGYILSHRYSLDTYPNWLGILHTKELPFVLGDPIRKADRASPDDIRLSRLIMKYWANFARTGDPNVNANGSSVSNFWPKYDENGRMIVLNAKNLTVVNEYRKNECSFWENRESA